MLKRSTERRWLYCRPTEEAMQNLWPVYNAADTIAPDRHTLGGALEFDLFMKSGSVGDIWMVCFSELVRYGFPTRK